MEFESAEDKENWLLFKKEGNGLEYQGMTMS